MTDPLRFVGSKSVVGVYQVAGVLTAELVDGTLVTLQPLDADLTTIAGLTPTTDNVIQSVGGSWASRTMAQFKVALAMTAADVAALPVAGGTLSEAANVILGTTTGTKIGTAITQKLGFFNATPIVQPTSGTDLGSVLSTLGLRAAGTNYAHRIGYLAATTTTSLNVSSPSFQACNATGGAFNVTPPGTTIPGVEVTIKKVDASANAVTVIGTIDGATNYSLATQYKYVTIITTGVVGTFSIKAAG